MRFKNLQFKRSGRAPFLAVALLSMATAFTGCLNDSGSLEPSSLQEDEGRLVIKTSVQDISKIQGLGKSSVITLKKLIITLKSNDSVPLVRRDTVLADTGAFVSSVSADQSVSRAYAVKGLRSWSVVVKTLDAKDSVIHFDSTFVSNLLLGETRQVTLNMSSRFVMYEAKFTVPDSLRFTGAGFAKQLFVNRVVLRVNGVIVTDTTRQPRFAASTTTPPVTNVNTVRFDYIRSNETPDVAVEFYGNLGLGTNDTLMFLALFENVNPSESNPPALVPTYKGPDADQINQNGIIGFVINIGKVGTVVFNVNINGNLPKPVISP